MNNNRVRNYQMGKLPKQWKDGAAKSITFVVTEDCNLLCNYCYITGKNSKNKMTFDIAKKAIDYILDNRKIFDDEAVMWEFIGGEPFLEIELIDKICDYIKFKMYSKNHPWFDAYMFNFSTNGITYHTKEVQDFIQKNHSHLSIGISVDGNKIKHDLQRVYPDGRGSYNDVIKNVPLWLKQFPIATTKATFSHDDLPYLKDSIVSLWNNGIKTIAANIIFEDVWTENDDVIYEKQLMELADYILENGLWEEYSVRFFDENIGFPLDKNRFDENYCGSGKMLAIDYKGDLYPCVRFIDYSLTNRKGYKLGNIFDGINLDKVRPFKALTLSSQSKEECMNCEVAEGCAWCSGYNYDAADTDTIFQRATYICNMHKANCKANDYFWGKFEEKVGFIPIGREERLQNKYMRRNKFIIMTSDKIVPHCNYVNKKQEFSYMSHDLIEKGMQFAKNNNFEPVFLYDNKIITYDDYLKNFKSKEFSNPITICENEKDLSDNSILKINKLNIETLSEKVKKMSGMTNRINVVLDDINEWEQENITKYRDQLDEIIKIIYESVQEDEYLEVDVLTDILNLKEMCNCDAGENSYTLAPNGNIYLCPAFYFNDENDKIGDLNSGIKIINENLLNISSSAVCKNCDAYHCKRCKFLNKLLTSQINIPSKIQCLVSHTERNSSIKLQDKLKEKNINFENVISKIDYLDPIELL